MLLLLSFYVAVWCLSESVIMVNNTNYSSGCSPCKTFDCICDNLTEDGTEIFLCKGTYVVLSDIVVRNFSDLTLHGDNAEVRCSTGFGIKFVNILNFVISGLTIKNCGTIIQNSAKTPFSFLSAVSILNSMNVTIEDVEFIANLGTGLTIFDTSGDVSITNVTFLNNSVPKHNDTYSGGGGLYIKFTGYNEYENSNDSLYYPCNSNNTYTITNCYFIRNAASLSSQERTLYLSKNKGPLINVLGGGGGLQIVLEGKPQYKMFLITDSFFLNNRAEFGGGISIIASGESSHNQFDIIGIQLEDNIAHEGGGGIDFGFYTTEALEGMNSFHLEQICFSGNHAKYGGGVQHFSARSSPYSSNTHSNVQFTNCSWNYNSAIVGAAVALYPEVWQKVTSGYLSTPLFNNCNFENNSLNGYKDTWHIRGGVFFTGALTANFSGNILFLNNQGSSMHMSAAEIHVLPNTVMEFNSNTASRGAGITLMGDSYVITHNNSHLIFKNNKALDKGGAIFYYSINSLDYLDSYKCFFRYVDLVPVKEWNAKFTFINNTADLYGYSIYATTLQPCVRSDITNETVDNATDLLHWSIFQFTPSESPKHTISTDPIGIVLNEKIHSCFPGQKYHLPIKIHDELHQEMGFLLTVSYNNSFTTANVTYIENTQSITLKGHEKSIVSISLNTSSNSHVVGQQFNVHLTECPPGYKWTNDGICECIASSPHKVLGIFACNHTLGRAYMRVGFWAGCSTNGQLVTSACPLRFCMYNHTTNSLFLLPSRCSELEKSICGPAKRTGLLCGECMSEYSVFYHSDRFKCDKCSHSDWYRGILKYFATELLPLTILFCFIILFDVSLTSGAVNSFVFFAQILDISEVSAYSQYNLPSQIKNFSRAYWFLFGFLNFDFFRHDSLSFCLFNKATVLDVLAFKYVTTLYGLFLVCCLFFLLKINRFNRILQKIRSDSKSKHYTVTNGLTAFLILSYSQCSKVSFQILADIKINTLHANGSEENAVYLSGTTEYFGREHIKYAIPALLMLTFAVIVPLILTLNPIYHFCMETFCASRRPITNCASINRPFSKVLLYSKPIIDALQACYKDHCRFFAGSMFLYRLMISATFAFAKSNIHGFALLELIIIFILMTHAAFQPYQKRLYNIIDSLVLADLAVINAITLFNNTSIEYDIPSRHTTVLGTARIILVYIPIVCFICLFVVKLILYVKKRCEQHKETNLVNDHFIDAENSSGFASNTLPARMIQEDLRANMHRRQSSRNLDSNSTEMFDSDKFVHMTGYGTM